MLGFAVADAERDAETVHTLTLIRRAQGGELGALERLFARYYVRVGHLVRRRLGGELRAHFESADLLQEALLEAFRDFDRYEIRRNADFMDWLAAIIENRIRAANQYIHREKRDRRREVALDHIRKSVSNGSLVLEPSAGLVPHSQRLMKEEEKLLLWEVLEGLPEEYRRVIVMRHFDKLRWDEVAEALGRASPDAARMLYARAKGELKKRLSQRLGD